MNAEILALLVVTTFLNFIVASPLISLLKRFKFFKTKKIKKEVKGTRNKSYYTFLEKTIETPSSYGIILIANLIAWYFLTSWDIFKSAEYYLPTQIFILSVIFLVLGLIDDIVEFFFYMKIGRWGLPAKYKLLLEFALSFAFFYFTSDHSLMFESLLLNGFFALLVTFTLNAYNITDGLDGLIGGISIIMFVNYFILEINTHNDPAILALLAVLTGVFFAFLMFNINPAKVFFGDSGALCVGVIVAILGFRYGWYALPTLLIIWAEGISSFLQIMSIKIRKQKLFIIAPFHLHLLNKGVERNTIVFYAWVLQGFLAVISLMIFFYLNPVEVPVFLS